MSNATMTTAPTAASQPGSTTPATAKVKVATTWLEGCSGCHMSFLDIDERLLVLAEKIELVYSPLVDRKDFPDMVDVTLVEGAIATDEDVAKMRKIRAHTKVLISLGDCAVTGNVTAIRNVLGGAEPVLRRSYLELASSQLQLPADEGVLPILTDRVRPVHEVVPVDFYLPGCPPPAGRIRAVLEAWLAGKEPRLEGRDLKFG